MNKLIFYYSFILLAALFVSVDAMSQKRFEMRDSTGLHAYTLVRGDEGVVLYDSAFLLNKKMYYLLRDTYNRVRNGNTSAAIDKLFEQYDSIVNFQDSMIKRRDENYKELKTSFDNLANQTNSFVDRTDANLSSIDTAITAATNHVNEIKTMLAKSIKEIQLQQKQKFKLVLGGFTVGVGVASLIFLIAK